MGKFNEFDQLRVGGVRHADIKGFEYSREDVDARSLANAYAQWLGQVFTREIKPMEVEILVAEVGAASDEGDQLYHIDFSGTIFDEDHFAVLGGEADTIHERMATAYTPGWDLGEALRAATTALAGPDRALHPADLEVAVLERHRDRRAFRRIVDGELAELLAAPPAPDEPPPPEPTRPEPKADQPPPGKDEPSG